MNQIYSNLGEIKIGYRNQLIHYYNKGIGNVSEIAGAVVTASLIKTIEKRYVELGGVLPISKKTIQERKGQRWGYVNLSNDKSNKEKSK